MAYDPPSIPENLKEPERKLWEDYAFQMSHGQRKTHAPETLRKLIVHLKGYSADESRSFLESLFEKDPNNSRFLAEYVPSLMFTNIKIPAPLLEEVVLPELIRGYLEGEPNYARWLGQVYNQALNAAVHKPELREKVDFYKTSQIDLFQEAVDQYPHDNKALYLLTHAYLGQLGYAFHEVPTGVLGSKEWLDEMLEKAAALLIATGLLKKYRKRLSYWQFHAAAWDEYLKHRQDYVNYRFYLHMHPRKKK